MRAIVLSNALSTCLFLASAGIATPQEPSAPSPGGTIERLDPALDALLAADSMVEKVAGGFQFIEGPLWVGSGADGYLLFSDIPANKIYRWTASAGANVFLEPVMAPDAKTGGTGGSNGLALDPDGRVVLFEHGNRQVSRLEADGRRTVLADRYEGKRLNSPNDGVFHRDGSLYFTDPPYGLAGQDQDPNKELVSNGIFRLLPDGTLRLLNDQQTRPNGIGLSPDQRTLYVANSAASPHKLWMAYPVAADGSIGAGRVFCDANPAAAPGVPDGLTVDARGNVWATGPGGVWVLSPEGRHLGTIKLAELPANAGWGDDGQTLYMTARTGLYRVRTLSGR